MSDNREVLLMLGRVDGKMDLMLTRSAEHETRIASLESWQNRMSGILAFAGFAITTALGALAFFLPK